MIDVSPDQEKFAQTLRVGLVIVAYPDINADRLSGFGCCIGVNFKIPTTIPLKSRDYGGARQRIPQKTPVTLSNLHEVE